MNNKVIVFLLLLTFLFSSIAFADGEKTLFSGSVQSGELKIGEQSAFITIIEGKVRVKYLDRILVVGEGQCKEDTGIIVCASGISAPFDASITIKASIASLEVEKTYTSKDYTVGDIINVKTVIKNNGKAQATNLIFKDDTKDFAIINPKGCDINGTDLIIIRDSMGASGSLTCEYGLKVIKDGSFSRTARVEYFDGMQSNSASASANFNVLPFGFGIKSSLDTEKLKLGQENKVWFNLTLKSPKETKVNNLRIIFPETVSVTRSDGTSGNTIDWSGLVGLKKSIYLDYNVTVLDLKPSTVSLLIDFIADRIASDSKEFPLNIAYSEPVISFRDLNFSKTSSANGFYIKNPNDFELSSVKVKLSSAKLAFEPSDFDVGAVPPNKDVKAGEFNLQGKEGLSPLFADISFNAGKTPLKLTKSFTFSIDTTKSLEPSPEKKVDANPIVLDTTNNTKNNNSSPKKTFLCTILGWLSKRFC